MSRPSLNRRSSSTSNRRHLLLIRRLPLHGEWNVLIGEGLQGRFGHEVLTRAEHAPRKAAKQKGQRALFGFTVGKDDRHHVLKPPTASRDWHNTAGKRSKYLQIKLCALRNRGRSRPFAHYTRLSLMSLSGSLWRWMTVRWSVSRMSINAHGA